MADGNVGEYQRYQRMEIVEFHGMLDLWEDRLQKEAEAAKAKAG